MKWLRHWWWRRQRNMDLVLLWPVCKQHAPDLEMARQVFMYHAIRAPCWVRFYEDQLASVVWKLT